MSADANRSGAAASPTQTDAGTNNDPTAPRRVEFRNGRGDPVYARPVFVHNGNTNAAILVKVNATAANDFDNDSDDDGGGYFTIAVGGTAEVSAGGIINVTSVSFVTQNASDSLDNVSVVGWTQAI